MVGVPLGFSHGGLFLLFSHGGLFLLFSHGGCSLVYPMVVFPGCIPMVGYSFRL